MWVGGLLVNVSCFLWCTWCNLEYLAMNKNHQAIQIYHSMLELLFWVCFCIVVLNFSKCNKWISSAGNKGQSTVNYCQFLAFNCPYLSCNDHCDQWLFQEVFWLLLFLFPRNSFEWSWTLELVFLELLNIGNSFLFHARE